MINSDPNAQRSVSFVARGALTTALLLASLPAQSIQVAQSAAHASPLSVVAASVPKAPSALPPVSYEASTNTIYIGREYDPLNGAEAQYVGYPSKPGAPKDEITIPELATALPGAAAGKLVNEGGGAWLLSADIVVSQTAQLNLTESIPFNWLRINSTPTKLPRFNRIIAVGGTINIDNVKVTSWNTDAESPATEYGLGRAYLAALVGARLDIVDAEVSHLGYVTGEPSGLSWRKQATEGDVKTGATGSIINSKIHDNYFGMYSYAAFGIVIENSDFYDNVVYGIDPHDGSTKFVVRGNRVHDNGKHGIIFSRLCVDNLIENNEVYNNAEHGIMMDRGSNNNNIVNNNVYGNVDGIAIFQSSGTLIQGNILRNNTRGVRINATYDINDEFDGISTNNFVISNTIENNTQYGIYLYERADRNTIKKNAVIGNASSGIYLKTGGNYISANDVQRNDEGIYVVGVPLSPLTPTALISQPVAALETPGENNIIVGNSVVNNDTGIRLTNGKGNHVGENDKLKVGDIATNTVRINIRNGVLIETIIDSIASVDNDVIGNVIEANGRNGVFIQGSASIRNKISRNSITANNRAGIDLRDNANLNLAAPIVGSNAISGLITGTAPANAVIEIYRDPNGQGKTYLGSTTANASGAWQFNVPVSSEQGAPSALAIDANGNTSRFGSAVAVETPFSVDISGTLPTVSLLVSGEGSAPTLAAILTKLQAVTSTQYLVNEGNGVWLANANLIIGRNVTLTLSPEAGVTYLKLRSNPTISVTKSLRRAATADEDFGITADTAKGDIDYASFSYLRTSNGALLLDRVKVTSWDTTKNAPDTDYNNGRAYVIAKYDARMDIVESDLSYLGSPDGESYGVVWRDATFITETVGNGSVITTYTTISATGSAISSTFSHNYYGVYTYRAKGMAFRGNTFSNNVGYGMDPHDYTNAVVIDNNDAFGNGNHGFIISRGCYNIVFTRNRSHDNKYTLDTQDRNAQGFMIDAGSAESQFLQVPSESNILDGNWAWNNDGYGLRIVKSHQNLIQRNAFWSNAAGISIEDGSYSNTVRLNELSNNVGPGLVLMTGSYGNPVDNNVIHHNGEHGIYLKGAKLHAIRVNQIYANVQAGIKVNVLDGYDTRQNNWQHNSIYENGSGGVSLVTGTNESLAAPVIVSATTASVFGTAPAGTIVEVFSDYQNEGRFYEGTATVGISGQFSLTVSGQWKAPRLTAVAINGFGNASEFSKSETNGVKVKTYLPLMRR